MIEPVRGPIRVGDVVHGYLAGYFGRDHYDCARVEAIGADWAVLRTFDGVPTCGMGPKIGDELALSRDTPESWGNHTSGCPADRWDQR